MQSLRTCTCGTARCQRQCAATLRGEEPPHTTMKSARPVLRGQSTQTRGTETAPGGHVGAPHRQKPCPHIQHRELAHGVSTRKPNCGFLLVPHHWCPLPGQVLQHRDKYGSPGGVEVSPTLGHTQPRQDSSITSSPRPSSACQATHKLCTCSLIFAKTLQGPRSFVLDR